MVQNAQMKILKSMFRFAIFCLLLSCSANPQQLPSAITTDPAPDKNYPAGMQAPDIMSHGARLNAVIFLASGAGLHPTVLLLHGFPGNEKNLDLAYVLRRAGWNVLFPHYRGSWGSAGNFSFSNALEDTQVAVDFLRDPANVKKYRIDPSRIVLIGHSMGGLMAAYAAAHDPRVSAIAIMAAWNLGAFVTSPTFEQHTDTFHDASPRLVGTTPQGMIAEAKAHAKEWNYIDYAEKLKTRPVLILEANDGNRTNNQALAEALCKSGDRQVTEKYMETDHSFSDHRIAVQVAILEWLQSLLALESK
jgi:dipeptidyl aminopeptidase/acylaminoacyl peptidase